MISVDLLKENPLASDTALIRSDLVVVIGGASSGRRSILSFKDLNGFYASVFHQYCQTIPKGTMHLLFEARPKTVHGLTMLLMGHPFMFHSPNFEKTTDPLPVADEGFGL